MTSRVWVTRTEPGASRSVAAWAAAGFEAEGWPILRVVPVAPKAVIPDDAILVFTSANAVAQAGVKGDGRLVYAVGDATASALRKAGFTQIRIGGGNVSALGQIVETTEKPVIHICGERVAGDLVGALRARGLTAERCVVYRTEPREDWPDNLARGDWVALYSPHASRTLVERWPDFDLRFAAMSAAIAEPLGDRRVVIAEALTEAAMIEAVRFATTSQGK